MLEVWILLTAAASVVVSVGLGSWAVMLTRIARKEMHEAEARAIARHAETVEAVNVGFANFVEALVEIDPTREDKIAEMVDALWSKLQPKLDGYVGGKTAGTGGLMNLLGEGTADKVQDAIKNIPGSWGQ